MNKTIAALAKVHVGAKFKFGGEEIDGGAVRIRCDVFDALTSQTYGSGLGSTAEAALIAALRKYLLDSKAEYERAQMWLEGALADPEHPK